MNLFKFSFAAIALSAFLITGCGDTSTKDKSDDKKTADHDDHDREEAPHHAHGPNDGSHFVFGDTEEFAGEVVTYGENDLVKVMFCDFKGKKTVSLNATKLSIVRKAGDNRTPFDLEAIKPDDEGKTDGFKLEDKDLKIAIGVGAVIVKATIDGKEYEGTAYPHNH
jgi:PBP1b-binding outer membrane lipoprotein LpoB